MLEYYEGILFLATNRLETMDVAFQSRIHVPVKIRTPRFHSSSTNLDEFYHAHR